jgi:hypothetical protein
MEYRQKLTDVVIKENTQVTLLDKELAYYQDLVKSVQGIGSRPTGSPELIAMVKSRSQAAFAAIAKGADQLVDLYTELSAKNLNPAARLYAITGPFTRHTQSSVSFRSLAYSYLFPLGAIITGEPYFVQTKSPASIDYAYFSYTTLATVGYGDFTAATGIGRMISISEALVGQLFLVSAVALLVGNIGRTLRPAADADGSVTRATGSATAMPEQTVAAAETVVTPGE